MKELKELRSKIDSIFTELEKESSGNYNTLKQEITYKRVEVYGAISGLINNKKADKRKVSDSVNHPSHYNQHPSGVECIDIARHYCFSIGNAIKYLWRAGFKKDAKLTDKQKETEDLKKAIWYIEDRIKELET